MITCPMCDRGLYLDTATGSPTCIACCGSRPGQHLVALTLLTNSEEA